MRLTQEQLRTWRRLASAPQQPFSALVEISGLDPSCDFRGADLAGVDFGDADLRSYDFEGSDLRGADLSRARISIQGLRRAQIEGARLPKRLDLQPHQIEAILAVIDHLRQQHTRALVSLPQGTGATRTACELVREFVGADRQAMPLLVTFGRLEAQTALEALGSVGVSAAPIEELRVGARAVRSYVCDYDTAVRHMRDPKSPLRPVFRDGAFSHVVCLGANHAPGKLIRTLLDETRSRIQIAFVVGGTHEGSVVERHFRGDLVYTYRLEDVVADGRLPEFSFQLTDLRGRLSSRLMRDVTTPTPVVEAMRDFTKRLEAAKLLFERSLVLCPTRADANRAADELNHQYHANGWETHSDPRNHHAAEVPDSRRHADYLLRRRRGSPYIVCCTTHALGVEELELSAIAVLVRSPGLRTPHILDMSRRPGGSKPVLIFDYAGAAVRSLAQRRRVVGS